MLREPKIIDPHAEYIFVTDRPTKSKNWKIVVDDKLVNKHPIYSSYYVRYHPFEYASSDIAIVIDASIQINESLNPFIQEFLPHEYSLMLTNFRTDEDKLRQWMVQDKRISHDDYESIIKFLKTIHQENWKGSIGRAFIAQKNTQLVNRFNKHVWRYLLALGQYGIPNRQDEIIAHKLLLQYMGKIDLYLTSTQFIQSSYMTYCCHKSSKPIGTLPNYDQYYYLCNKPASPFRFDKSINFPTSYQFKTEAILLTKYLNRADLIEWLDHHLMKVKFDHIHVFDNESSYDVKAVCDMYGDRVSYQKVYGQARQYRLYDAYINNISAAEWVMPIDDDEYLDIGDFDSVYDAIKYYDSKFPHMMSLGVRWKHLFPEKFHSERTGRVLDYCKVENSQLAKTFMHLGDSTVKCLVKRYGNIHYEETWENPAGGHVPKHTCFCGAVMCDGRAVLGCGIPDCPETLDDERIRLLHCRYKGYSDWVEKYGNNDKTKNCHTVCDSYQRAKRFKFNELLDTLE